MKTSPLLGLVLTAASALSCSAPPITAQPAATSVGYQSVLLNSDNITAVRDALRAGHGTPAQQAALEVLIKEADAALELPIVAVTDKRNPAPSGSKNDYVSFSPYWWPNPDTADGLPYVRRDGEFNPERDNYDVPRLTNIGNTTRWLGAAYYFTGDEKYAANAVERIKVWFLNPDTRMTPRVQYGQFVPGVADEGRHVGIIETVRLRWFPDTFNMLADSPHMTSKIDAGVRQWFGDYAQWLMDSEFGTLERTYANNHGTWANEQAANFATFAGRDDIVKAVVATIPDRIAAQIEPDGSQPHELERTTSLHYSDFNLRAMMDLATLAQNVDVDLWNYETPDGASIRAAADFIQPYIGGEQEWPHEQIRELKALTHAQAMRTAYLNFGDAKFEAALDNIKTLPGWKPEGLIWLELLMPKPDAAIHTH